MARVISVTFQIEDPIMDKLKEKKAEGFKYGALIRKAVEKYYGGDVVE
jgi:hypothetical protein